MAKRRECLEAIGVVSKSWISADFIHKTIYEIANDVSGAYKIAFQMLFIFYSSNTKNTIYSLMFCYKLKFKDNIVL